jgi:hypothetical protein
MIHKILANNTLSVLILAAVIVLICVLVLNFAFQSTLDRVEWSEDLYIVDRGDSLWSISGEYCPDNVDRREWIDEIRALNGMVGSSVYPGQALTILVPAK